MNFISEIIANEPLMSAMVGWALAAFLKFLIVVVTLRRVDWERLLGTGGMPSTHTTPVVACATSIGLVMGFSSPVFALAVVLSIIVSYDAAGIRRHAGEQARAINSLISDIFEGGIFKGQKSSDFLNRWKLAELKTLIGHNPAEVVVGIALGIMTALMMHFQFGYLFPDL